MSKSSSKFGLIYKGIPTCEKCKKRYILNLNNKHGLCYNCSKIKGFD